MGTGREIGEISSCPESYGLQLYPHAKNCDQFYKCANGTLTLETCGNGLLFDGKGSVHNYCNYYWNTECGERVYERTLPYDTLRYLMWPYGSTLRYLMLPFATYWLTLLFGSTLSEFRLRYVNLCYLTLPRITLSYLMVIPLVIIDYCMLSYDTLCDLTLPYITLYYLTLPYGSTWSDHELLYVSLWYLMLPYVTLRYLMVVSEVTMDYSMLAHDTLCCHEIRSDWYGNWLQINFFLTDRL